MSETFKFKVLGQEGEIPQIMLGTSQLLGEEGENAILSAIKVGYKGIDTALLYRNQVEVGNAVKKSGIDRQNIWITSKVAFFPPDLTKEGDPLSIFNPNNLKGSEQESIDLTLQQLQTDYVDLLLVHTPTTSPLEYKAAVSPHLFEYFNVYGKASEFNVTDSLIELTADRSKVLEERRKEALEANNKANARALRESTWKAMELALEQKKCKYIGVSNYPVELLLEMKEYAKVMPAINQLELHPKFSSPELQRVCKELGVVLIGYGSGTFTSILEKFNPEEYQLLQDISKRLNKTPGQIILRWTTQSGVVIIPRSKSEHHQLENLQTNSFTLSEEDMNILNKFNNDYPHYWDPVATVQTI